MTKIYYFSGRGRSLFVARELSLRLNAGDPVPMTGKHRSGLVIPGSAGRVGFVFPVIDFGVPVSVRHYLSRYPKEHEHQYVFAVATNMGMPCAALTQFRTLLRRRNMNLDAAFSVEQGPHVNTDRTALQSRITGIAEIIEAAGTADEHPGNFADKVFLTGAANALARVFIGAEDRKFSVNGQCNGCGICTRVCAAGNIVLRNNKPVWLHFCDQCGACFSWCPRKAITGTCLAARAGDSEAEISVSEMTITNGDAE
jgi:ferredoxin